MHKKNRGSGHQQLTQIRDRLLTMTAIGQISLKIDTGYTAVAKSDRTDIRLRLAS
jgi:hypothetical protein